MWSLAGFTSTLGGRRDIVEQALIEGRQRGVIKRYGPPIFRPPLAIHLHEELAARPQVYPQAGLRVWRIILSRNSEIHSHGTIENKAHSINQSCTESGTH